MSHDPHSSERAPERRRKRKKFTLWFWGGVGIAALISFFVWLFWLRHFAYTDDAYVHGNKVYITPLHPGFVTAIHTDDTFLVKQGQLLVELDETDAKIALERAKEGLAEAVRKTCEEFHQVFVYDAEIDLKRAELLRDAQDYFHRSWVFRQQGVSLEDYEHAIAALRAQYASLQMSGALYRKALSLVQNTSIRSHPRVVAAADQVRDAWVRLYRCKIYAPVDGLAAERTIQVGMWIPAGELLMCVIPLDQIWVNANYKETQMKKMRLGQKVDVTVDLWGVDQVFHGTIVGMPGGAGNAFSLLPPQNLSGNWIKIVQRLPVRVALDPDEIAEHPLRLGLSCRAWTDLRGAGEVVPTTSAGSPLYQTPIFGKEEAGDLALVEEVVALNLDPSLDGYREAPLELAEKQLSLPPLLEEALEQEEALQREIFTPSPQASLHSPLFDHLYRDYLQ